MPSAADPTTPLATSLPAALAQELLLAWYEGNRRDLPWRESTDPYAVLVSEVMSQQTQVDRVVPRWVGWVECPRAAPCPARGRRFEPLRRQGPFEGSFRQRRAATLRLVADAEQALDELDADAVASLAKDGLVRVEAGSVSLPA